VSAGTGSKRKYAADRDQNFASGEIDRCVKQQMSAVNRRTGMSGTRPQPLTEHAAIAIYLRLGD